jgi:hypothetical protein
MLQIGLIEEDINGQIFGIITLLVLGLQNSHLGVQGESAIWIVAHTKSYKV